MSHPPHDPLILHEVEVSLTSRCTLACSECGFLVPHQPEPHEGDPAVALQDALDVLQAAGVRIASLALLGGEATLVPHVLRRAIETAANSQAVDRIELVTNGLTPRGLDPASLDGLHRVSLSDYTDDEALFAAWARWLEGFDVELVRRRHTGWDPNTTSVDLGEAGGQHAYDHCWYRRHCITLERGRLFVCSRLPKVGHDDAGLPVVPGLTAESIRAHLTAPTAPSGCRTCTPMAGLPQVAPGIQPDDRLERLRQRALAFLAAHTPLEIP